MFWSRLGGKEAVLTVVLALLFKTLMAAFMLIVFYQLSDFEQVRNLWNRWYSGKENVSAWYIPFANWDGQHYLLLADSGYVQHVQRSWGFYPLYPGLIRLLSFLFPTPLSALLLNYLFTAGFCVFVYRIGAHFNCRKPHLAVFLLITFPTAFYTVAVYTESLFLFLQTGFLYHFFVTRSRMRLLYALLLPLSRGTAVFVAGGLLLYTALECARALIRALIRARARAKAQAETARRGKNRKHGKNLKRRKNSRNKPIPEEPIPETEKTDWYYHLYTYAAFVAGALVYLLFYAVAAGDPLAGLDAQKTFISQNSITHLFNPLIFINNLFAGIEGVFIYQRSLLDRIFLVLFLSGILVFVAWREWTLLCFYFPIVYSHMAMSLSPMSYSRYVLVALPFLAFALLKNLPSSRLPYALCAVFFALQLYLAHRFSLNEWVG